MATEPWLRGPIPGVHPLAMPFFFSLTQVREDLKQWTAALSTDQLWAEPQGLGSVGFHIRHIGGATGRLAIYLKGGQLNEAQIEEMKSEKLPGASLEQLLAKLEEQFLLAEETVKSLDPRSWNEPRSVGRKGLPTTVGGLVHHIAEHAQRHLGEIIVTSKIVRQPE